MTQEQIHTTLDKMLENPKSKNFLNHLVRSYMPTAQIEKVLYKPQGDFKCAISGDKLFSSEEILEGIQGEEFKSDFLKSLKTMFDDKADTTSPMEKLIGDRKMGLTGKGTTTYLSYPVAQEFYNWIATKALTGDKHINWLLGSIRHSSLMGRAKNIQNPKVQEKVKKEAQKFDRTAQFQLGDSFSALANLKAKLENEEK